MIRSILAAALLVAGAAHAQTYDADGDGDIDDDDWEAMPPPPPSDDQNDVVPGDVAPAYVPTQQTFEQQLSPYGVWVDEAGVGRVWVPAQSEVGVEFTPYTSGGSWVYTPVGWQFQTTYRFGSAPFHYGRWHLSSRYGWVWWPEYTWGASWVDWRMNRGGNVAWAPLPPPGVRVSFGLGAVGWSFAAGRYHRPYVSSFHSSWGRPGYYSRGGARYYGGGYRSNHYYGGGGYRGGNNYHPAAPAAPAYRGGGYYGGGGGNYHPAPPAAPAAPAAPAYRRPGGNQHPAAPPSGQPNFGGGSRHRGGHGRGR